MKLPANVGRLLAEANAIGVVARAGMIRPDRPSRLIRMKNAMSRYGTVGGAITVAAIRRGNRIALIDELGSLSFTGLDNRSNALANALRERGVEAGDVVGIVCRNHRGIFDITYAAGKLGLRAVYLNTDFAAPQMRDVCAREGVALLVYDEEFAGIAEDIWVRHGHVLGWTDKPAADTLEQLIADGDPTPPPPPAKKSSMVLLTSGTTGIPKGAPRALGSSLVIPGGVLSKIPYRTGQVTFVAAPMFHGWGMLNAMLSVGVGATVVVQRRFSAERVLDALAYHDCTGLAVVPIMLARILALGEEEVRRRDLSQLRIVASAGSQLPTELATRAMDLLGDVVYNLYGSTEVAYATIATPADMRSAPGTVGKPPYGFSVRIYDEHGKPVPTGTTGRIFIGNGVQFEGYTGGGTKEVIDGLMSSGDVGHLDDAGRLFVEGRDDEMIISGGENVFPREVEEIILKLAGVADAAAIGVPDAEYGQRLRAFVVCNPGNDLSAEDVRAWVKANLARYKVPRDVVFIDELPRNPSGKVLKRRLAAIDATASS